METESGNNDPPLSSSVLPEMTKQLVLLLRNPREGEPDPFEEELSDHGFSVGCVPVLEFTHTNISFFADHLTRGSDQFSAIIFTSKRAVEAACKAMEGISDEDCLVRCKSLPCYVVGTGTYQDAKAAGFLPINHEAGNAECLAQKIINDLTTCDKPLLYPCGNLRRDTLSNVLIGAGFSLTEVEVYTTQKTTCLKEHYLDFVMDKGLPEYVVYFSPSGVQSTEELFVQHLLPVSQVKLVAIGPTTEKELHLRGIPVHAVAASPDPTGLVKALQKN